MFLFDIDCTLLMAGGAGRVAFDHVFLELFGIPDAYGLHEPHGKTDPQIIDEIAEKAMGRRLTAGEHARVFDLYLARFKAAIGDSPRFRVMDGARELVARIARTDGVAMGIQTGNFAEAARLKLERGGFGGFFKFGGYGCDAAERTGVVSKAHERGEAWAGRKFAKADVIVVGDAAPDMKAGSALGFRTVGVLTGRHTREMLEAAGADLIIDDLTRTQEFFKFCSIPV